MSATTHNEPAFTDLVQRLSRQSVDKKHDAYEDVAWDSPEMALYPTDPRHELWPFDPLAATAWYQALPVDDRARLGLHRLSAVMKTGWHFENLLQRGLLDYSTRLPNGDPAFRYLHHEIIEESQHTLMFQEFVNRTGLPIRGMPRPLLYMAERVVLPLPRLFPELFFMFVLGGEDPVDHIQKRQLREGTPHPLTERIMRIHVTEEARHLSYARQYLKTSVPKLGFVRRHIMAIAVPIVFGIMAPLMVAPSTEMRRAGVPWKVLWEARTSPAYRSLLKDSVHKPRRLAEDLGLMTALGRRLWKRMGLA